MTQSTETPATKSKGRFWPKMIVLALVLGVSGIAYFEFRDSLSLSAVASKETELRQFQQDHYLLVYGIALLIYVSVTGLSLPGATGLTLLYAWFFGFWRAVLLVSFASTAGATVAFLLSRFSFRDAVQQRFGDRLAAFNQALQREGAFYLFTLRLIPAIPFFVINVVMGLTPIRTRTFWWVSQIGMFPGTCVYVYAGSVVPNLQQLSDEGVKAALSTGQLTRLIVAFAMLGLFPLVIKKLLQRFRRRPVEAPSETR